MRTGKVSDGVLDLPFQGTERITRHCSYQGAQAAQPKAGSQALRVLLALKAKPQTMHELTVSCELPMSSICARLGWLRKKGLVQVLGARKNPTTKVNNSIWGTA